MPEILYKYLPNSRLSFFEDEFLRISPRSSLNDPFELLPAKPNYPDWLNYLNECKNHHLNLLSNLNSHEYKKHELHWKNNIEKELNNFGKKEVDTFYNYSWNEILKKIDSIGGIVSLSSRWDSPLMWAHYTNSHFGFCIGFDTEFITKNIAGIFKVQYSDFRYKIRLGETSEVNFNVFSTKSKDWSYEEEYRLFIEYSKANKIVKTDTELIYLQQFPKEAISEIIIGAKATVETIKIIKSFCLKSTIELYKASEADYTFHMDRTKCK